MTSHHAASRSLRLALLACFGVVLAACTTGEGATRADASEADGEEVEMEARYLALGDSYTIGERVEPSSRWPVQLVGMMRDEGVAIVEPQIIAQTGWTTDELDAAITAEDPQGPYAMVSLLIGVNNQYRGRDVEDFRGEFIGLLDRAAGFAGGDHGRVLVLSIPDWGVTPFAESRDSEQIAAEIDAYNAVCQEESVARGARFVDITPDSREHGATRVASDGLHPSGEMYTAWAEMALPVALEIVGR